MSSESVDLSAGSDHRNAGMSDFWEKERHHHAIAGSTHREIGIEEV
jgi:hypothetical protein